MSRHLISLAATTPEVSDAHHNPAHFHAWYGDYKVSVGIKNGVIKGEMPSKALKLIIKWLDLHKEELLINWEKAKKGDKLNTIEPLK